MAGNACSFVCVCFGFLFIDVILFQPSPQRRKSDAVISLSKINFHSPTRFIHKVCKSVDVTVLSNVIKLFTVTFIF